MEDLKYALSHGTAVCCWLSVTLRLCRTSLAIKHPFIGRVSNRSKLPSSTGDCVTRPNYFHGHPSVWMWAFFAFCLNKDAKKSPQPTFVTSCGFTAFVSGKQPSTNKTKSFVAHLSVENIARKHLERTVCSAWKSAVVNSPPAISDVREIHIQSRRYTIL